MIQSPFAGLSTVEAVVRLKSHGYNELPAAERRGVLRIAFEVVRQPMFALLIAGGVVYLILGDLMEAVLLLVFATLSVVISIVQESRSERVLEALRNLASPRALVIRDGKPVQIAGREVVCGDLLVITEGDRVAADATVVDGTAGLMLDESLLTGESLPCARWRQPLNHKWSRCLQPPAVKIRLCIRRDVGRKGTAKARPRHRRFE